MRLALAAALAALAAAFDLPFDRCASSHGGQREPHSCFLKEVWGAW